MKIIVGIHLKRNAILLKIVTQDNNALMETVLQFREKVKQQQMIVILLDALKVQQNIQKERNVEMVVQFV